MFSHLAVLWAICMYFDLLTLPRWYIRFVMELGTESEWELVAIGCLHGNGQLGCGKKPGN